MKAAAVLVAALVVLAGVLVAVLTVGRAAPERAGGGRVTGLGERGEVTAELDRLRTSVEALTARVERLEVARPAPVAPVTAGGGARSPADTVTAADLEALRQELAALRTPAGSGLAVSAAFEQQVLGVIEAQERREEEERAAARREAALTRIEERVAELAGELGLSSFQSGELLSILTDEDQRREAFFGQLREGGGFDRAAIRDGMQELRDTTLSAVKGVLSADQYERYLESSGSGFGFEYGRGSGGDGGDRGSGGR